jgi:hypothetical protein
VCSGIERISEPRLGHQHLHGLSLHCETRRGGRERRRAFGGVHRCCSKSRLAVLKAFVSLDAAHGIVGAGQQRRRIAGIQKGIQKTIDCTMRKGDSWAVEDESLEI